MLFNTKSEGIISLNLLMDAYRKLRKAKSEKLLLDYNYDQAMDEVAQLIGVLTKKYRSWKLKLYAKDYGYSLKALEKLKEKTTFVIERKAKRKLVSTPFSYTLNAAIDSMEDGSSKRALKAIGVPLLTFFATKTLGLGYVYHTGNTYIHVGPTPLDNLAGEVGIEFYLPTYEYKKEQAQLKMIIKDKKSVVFEKIITPFAPIDIISAQMNKRKLQASYAKLGARVGAKYITAIIAAYTTYKGLSSKDNPFASTIALGQYVLSSKAIKESEQADIRYWVTLPKNLYSVDVPELRGQFSVEIYTKVGENFDKLESETQVDLDSFRNIIPLHI
jgi:hypothetical protein